MGALPVGVQLVQRGIQVDFGCKTCGEPETITHVLRDCVFAQQVWNSQMVCLPPVGIHDGNLQAWICWNLWTARNQLVFENRAFTISEVIS